MFLRLWFEVVFNSIGRDLSRYELPFKWIPLNKGGAFRKWYGNNEYVIEWYNDGEKIKVYKGSVIRNQDYYFNNSITWTMLSASCFGVRLSSKGKVFEGAGPSLFVPDDMQYYILAFLCSKIGDYFIRILNPTININIGDVNNLPIKIGEKKVVDEIAKKCVELSKIDWDSFETSWEFVKHPLVELKESTNYGIDITKCNYTVSSAYKNWEEDCNERFKQLKANEEELNRIFIDIYGLQNELTPEVEDKDVTVRKADLQRDIKSFISYAVGCMFGRYSLDVDGLAYAGGQWDNSKYSSFIPDIDNCIPITDEEYFEDDIVGRFVEFVRVVYGKDKLEENLDFIAKALDVTGNTSREIIRNYFLNGFIKDHIKTYQKRPIYWLFDSGKQNGFKALVYMHRWNADTIGNMRVEYLHRMQRVYEKEIDRMQEVIDNSKDNKEINAATKRKEKLQKQYKETKDYDAKVGHLALSRINIDLDDGVKVNYEKVQTANDGTKHQILVKI